MIIELSDPQASVLGPLLFLGYVNDLHYTEISNFILFAVDTSNLLHTFDPIQNIIFRYKIKFVSLKQNEP